MASGEPGDRKKRVELQYLEEARRASSVFPQGDFRPHERPDFLLATESGALGIEVTELCREAPRAEAGRLAKVHGRARALYSRRPGATPVDVSPAFSSRAESLNVDHLAASLADFVYAHRDASTGFIRDLPDGYCHIGVFPPHDGGTWRYFRAGDTVVAPRELLASRIAEKNLRVPDYRRSANGAWLLIVNDQFLGAGEVFARPEDLAAWTFTFDFDRVLLFSREPGGSGRVVKLRRA